MRKTVTRPSVQPCHGPGCDVPACFVVSHGRWLALLGAVVGAVGWVQFTAGIYKDHIGSEWRRRARI